MPVRGEKSLEGLNTSSDWDSPVKCSTSKVNRAREAVPSPATSFDSRLSEESIETTFENRVHNVFRPEEPSPTRSRSRGRKDHRHKSKSSSKKKARSPSLSGEDVEYDSPIDVLPEKDVSLSPLRKSEGGSVHHSGSEKEYPDDFETDASGKETDKEKDKDRDRPRRRSHRKSHSRSRSRSNDSRSTRRSEKSERSVRRPSSSKKGHRSRRHNDQRSESEESDDGPTQSHRSHLSLRPARNHKELENALVGAPADDDLAARVAYEQLSNLAGMSKKIQDAVEHSKVVFEKRVHKVNMGVMSTAFEGWMAARYGSIEKRKRLQRILRRMANFRLWQAWSAWLEVHRAIGPLQKMIAKGRAVIRRGCLKRCLAAWREINAASQRELDREYRERYLLEKQEDAFRRKRENRAMYLFRRRIMGKVWMAFDFAWERRRQKRAKMNRALMHMKKRFRSKAFNSWCYHVAEKKRLRGILRKALGRMANLKLARAWNTWYDLILLKRRRRNLLNKAILRMKNRMMSKGWVSWLDYLVWRRRKKKIIMRWMRPMRAKGFYGWIDRVDERKRKRAFAKGCILKMLKRRLSKAYEKWIWFLQVLAEERSEEYQEKLKGEILGLRGENGRLRRDNERFVRLIDSGEWGRSRIEEMNRTGKVLSDERQELTRLIQKLRTDYEALEMAKMAQAEEIRSLKERLLNGNFVQRNKLLVKGGSSYNGLVRALKNDVLEGGHLAKNPTVLYEVDKLSMDHVSIFPDGDLNVQAVRRDREPMTLSKGHHGYNARHPEQRAAAVKKVRIPADLDGSGRSDNRSRGEVESPRHTDARHSDAARGGGERMRLPEAAPAGKQPSKLVNTLKGLSPEEVDALEETIRQERLHRGMQGRR
mmetsp:Transcript_41989/g.50898  ORF Transcript_41989/g.50898 Transcript_41989/m.50898 type:complete len:875 (+) Transcript_41989:171-2795(+)